MKIDLAVWTAVNGYEWQPGHVYTPRELADYKDAIGSLQPEKLPASGLFLKAGKAVFWRAQIATRMDSRGRDAIYCVLGAVSEEKAAEIDFKAVFESSEFTQPRKPFPTTLDCSAQRLERESPLGAEGFDERRFKGVETLSEFGGWCEEARGGNLKIEIEEPKNETDQPLIKVSYHPLRRSEPEKVPVKPTLIPETRPHSAPFKDIPFDKKHDGYSPTGEPSCQADSKRLNKSSVSDCWLLGFAAGFFVGMALTALAAWSFWPQKKMRRVSPVVQSQAVSQMEPPSSANPALPSASFSNEEVSLHKKEISCIYCNGTGKVQQPCLDSRNSVLRQKGHAYDGRHVSRCHDCNGLGERSSMYGFVPCSECKGLGCFLCQSCKGSNRVRVTCKECGGVGRIVVSKAIQ